MIIGSLKDSARYESLNPYFKEAFDYLKKLDFKNLEKGKIILKEDALIVNMNESKLKTSDNAQLEVHNKYIDIQLPVSCAETFGWKYRSDCKEVTAPFDPEKDIEFYGDKADTLFTLQPGDFVIFFPEDAHAPCIGEGDIMKIIIKVSK